MTNISSRNVLGQLIVPDPTSVQTFFDDFHKYIPDDWFTTRIVSSVTTGATAGSEAIDDAGGGILTLTNATADDDSIFMQWKGDSDAETASEIFTLETDRKLWFASRVKVSDVDATDFIMGLQNADTTPLTAPANGVFFQSDDGDAELDAHVYKGSAASSSTNVLTLLDDTYFRLGFYFDGANVISFFNGDNSLGQITTNDFPTTELTVSFGVRNGEAAAKSMSIDYIFVAKERPV